MEPENFEYRISARLPLSGQYLVTRYSVDNLGKACYHSTLNADNMRWVVDASGFSWHHRFDSQAFAAKALRAKIRLETVSKVGPQFFAKMED